MELYEWQASGLRGALYRAPWGNFCMKRDAQECSACALIGTCPVAFLVATLDPKSERGVKVPRPYTIEPPPPGPRSASGSRRWGRAIACGGPYSEGVDEQVEQLKGIPHYN